MAVELLKLVVTACLERLVDVVRALFGRGQALALFMKRTAPACERRQGRDGSRAKHDMANIYA